MGILFFVSDTYRYLWDSLVDCYNLETAKSASGTIHPMHPAYPFVFFPLKAFIADLSGRSIHILRWASTVFSIIGLLAFHSILHRKTGSLLAACIGTAFLGILTAWWHHSITANTYIISTALFLLSAREFLCRDVNDRLRLPLHLIFLILSMLFLRFTSLFLTPFALAEYFIKRRSSGKNSVGWRSCIAYFIVGLVILLAAYLAFPVTAAGVNSYDSYAECMGKFDGALPGSLPDLERSFRGIFSAGLGSIAAVPREANISFQGEGVESTAALAGFYYAILVLITLGIFFSFRFFNLSFQDSSRMDGGYYIFLITSFLVVGGASVIFQPYSLSHRLMILPLIILMIVSWLAAILKKLPVTAHILWLVPFIALFVNNWSVKFEKDRVRENNPYIYEAEKAAAILKPEDLLIDSGVDVGMFRHDYILYFARVDSHHLFELDGVMEQDIPLFKKTLNEYVLRGVSIYVHEDAIADADSMESLAKGIGVDINPPDIRAFFDEVVAPDYYFTINEKNYTAMIIKTD